MKSTLWLLAAFVPFFSMCWCMWRKHVLGLLITMLSIGVLLWITGAITLLHGEWLPAPQRSSSPGWVALGAGLLLWWAAWILWRWHQRPDDGPEDNGDNRPPDGPDDGGGGDEPLWWGQWERDFRAWERRGKQPKVAPVGRRNTKPTQPRTTPR